MTILFLTRLFYPHIGGVEKHVMEVGKRLVKIGHRVIVITERLPRPFHGIAMTEEINGIKVYRIKAGKDDWFKKFIIWKNLWSLRDIIKSADIVHCHDVFFWYLPFRFLYPRKKIYTTFHGYESFPIKKRAILMHKISEKLSYGNICIGDFIKKWYGTRATFVSYGGVNVATENLEQRNKNKKVNAVFIGRLDDQTGILTYVKAFELVKKKFPDFDLLVIGDGPYRKQIYKKLKVIGFQKDPEKYFPQYHFAFVSRYLSILEAFAAKKLVFAVFDNPVKEDYLKMSPLSKYIIIEKDENSLADKIDFYLKHPKKEKTLIANAYKWASLQTWERVVEMYISLWKNK